MATMVKLGELIRQARRDRGWTLAKCAAVTGLSESAISKMERHGRGLRGTANFLLLACALGVDVGALGAVNNEAPAP